MKILIQRSFFLSSIVKQIIITTFLVILVFDALSLVNPAKLFIPNRDSGVFLYIGQGILENKVPYRDLWDHKGPVIFYLNAIGLGAAGGSVWGVWWLEIGFLLFTSLALFYVLSSTWGKLPALISISLFTMSFGRIIWPGNNLTEEYALLFQALTLLALVIFLKTRKNGYLFLIGISCAVLFLLRPNLIGVFLAVFLVLVTWENTGSMAARIKQTAFWIGLGFFLPNLAWVSYIGLAGGLPDFLGAFLRYNLVYSSGLGQNRLAVIASGINQISAVVFLSIILAAIGFASARFKSIKLYERGRDDLLLILGLVWLPIEIFFSTLSGFNYTHYFIPWLMPFAILACYVVSSIISKFSLFTTNHRRIYSRFASALLLLILFTFGVIGCISTWVYLSPVFTNAPVPINPEIAYLESLPPEQPVIIWGNETGYLFLSHRYSPTRFIYQYPLFKPNFVTQAMVDEFLAVLKRDKPILIDTSPTNEETVALNKMERNAVWDQESLHPILSFIETNYYQSNTTGSGWGVYQPIQ